MPQKKLPGDSATREMRRLEGLATEPGLTYRRDPKSEGRVVRSRLGPRKPAGRLGPKRSGGRR